MSFIPCPSYIHVLFINTDFITWIASRMHEITLNLCPRWKQVLHHQIVKTSDIPSSMVSGFHKTKMKALTEWKWGKCYSIIWDFGSSSTINYYSHECIINYGNRDVLLFIHPHEIKCNCLEKWPINSMDQYFTWILLYFLRPLTQWAIIDMMIYPFVS